MKLSRLLPVIFLLGLAACGPTKIKDLRLPMMDDIEGTVTQFTPIGFVLKDETGAVYVRAMLPNHAKLDLAPNERVRVYGNLEGGGQAQPVFDAYIIKKPSGEEIMLSVPNPHVNFTPQTK